MRGGGVVNVMVIDSRAEEWREVQRKANLSYDCHCNRIFSPDSSIRSTVARTRRILIAPHICQ